MNIIIQTIISALSGGGVGGLITVGSNLCISKYQKYQDAYYAAIRIVPVLDRYVNACADVVSDNGTSAEHYSEERQPQVDIPDPPIFSKDINWKSINAQLAYRILSFSNIIEEVNKYIGKEKEDSLLTDPYDKDGFFTARRDGYLKLGLIVVNLLKDLRKNSRLPTNSKEPYDQDFESFFKERLKKFYEMKDKVPLSTIRKSLLKQYGFLEVG